MEILRDGVQELPLLQHRLIQTLDLAKSCIPEITVSDDDDFGFMAINFLNKQIDHAGSLLLLIPRILIETKMSNYVCGSRLTEIWEITAEEWRRERNGDTKLGELA